MKIVDKNGVDQAVLTRVGAAFAAGARVVGGQGSRSRDSVEVSDLARALVKLIASGVEREALDPARAAQVALLRNAVAAGRYEPPLDEVARKLLAEFAAELPK